MYLLPCKLAVWFCWLVLESLESSAWLLAWYCMCALRRDSLKIWLTIGSSWEAFGLAEDAGRSFGMALCSLSSAYSSRGDLAEASLSAFSVAISKLIGCFPCFESRRLSSFYREFCCDAGSFLYRSVNFWPCRGAREF